MGTLAHLPAGAPAFTLTAAGPCRFFAVGGVPPGEFGEVRGYPGDPLVAPELPPGGLIAR